MPCFLVVLSDENMPLLTTSCFLHHLFEIESPARRPRLATSISSQPNLQGRQSSKYIWGGTKLSKMMEREILIAIGKNRVRFWHNLVPAATLEISTLRWFQGLTNVWHEKKIGRAFCTSRLSSLLFFVISAV